MASAFIFCPRPELSVEENTKGFIRSARFELTTFGAGLKFDDNVWDISDHVYLKGKEASKLRINFFAFSAVESAQVPLKEPFLSFAKAYFRYLYALRPTKLLHGRLSALKAVGLALDHEHGSGEIALLSARTLDSAARILQRRYSDKVAYRGGRELERMAAFLSEGRLTVRPIRWTNTLSRPSDTDRVGKQFDQRRAARLPSKAALTALPELFRLAESPVDLIVTSVAAILLSAPSRISEVLALPVNCEVAQEVQDKTTYRLRWWPSKNADPMLKPIYSGMTQVVKEALERLRRTSSPAHSIAAWYEANPDKLFLPKGAGHLRSRTWITLADVTQITGIENSWQWCMRNDIELIRRGKTMLVRFGAVERNILRLLPRGFPILNKETGLRYSEALLIVRKNELHPRRGLYLCMIDTISIGVVSFALGTLEGRSIFGRFGFKEPDGSRIGVTTHQFRHYLNTVAQMGGLSQLDIAKWSGRVDVRQNTAYDHVSSDEMLILIRNAVGDKSQMFGPLSMPPSHRLISRDEFAQLKVPTAHTTELGFCIHDFTMTPCELHRDCINCEELVCIKGDSVRSSHIKRQLDEARLLLERAESASMDGHYGADRWIVHHRATVARLNQINAILDDPSVPIGAFITLAQPTTRASRRLGAPYLLGGSIRLKLGDGERAL